MIFNLIKDFHEYEGCRCCRALVVRDMHYCENCFSHLFESMSEFLVHRGNEKYDLFSLWEWRPFAEQRILESLLISAKSRPEARALRPWVIEFLSKRLRFSNLNLQTTAFVVPPSERLHNHSVFLAKEFLQVMGVAQSANLFELGFPNRSSRKTTKNLGLQERRKLAAQLFEVPQIEKKYKAWIMIDDIVTTGVTARRVFKSLGEPKDFEVWSLASRSRLAPVATER